MRTPLQIRKVYSREETALWNWYLRHMASRREWQQWAAEALSELLQVPAGMDLRVIVSSGLEKETSEYPVRKQEIFIGREPENDIVLASPAITKRHARIWEENGEIYFEDLGSGLGTFAGDKKLSPNTPYAVMDGDRFTIFPYTLTVRRKRLWRQESRVEISRPELRPACWREFRRALPGMVAFPVEVEPAGKNAVLEVSREFLAGVIRRALYPREIPNGGAGLLPYDRGLVEFLLVAVLERANRQLAFPCRFALREAGAEAGLPDDEPGIAIAFLVKLAELAGAMRIFVPYGLLAAIAHEDSQPPAERLARFPLSWQCPAVAGEVELTPQELAALEPGDVVILNPVAELRLPGAQARGWRGAWQDSACSRLAVEGYFERKVLMPNEQADLSALPVLLHVIAGEKEMTLAELGALESGSVIELGRDISAAVDLALNGKRAGTGELVEIDGRLGVRVVNWSKP